MRGWACVHPLLFFADVAQDIGNWLEPPMRSDRPSSRAGKGHFGNARNGGAAKHWTQVLFVPSL